MKIKLFYPPIFYPPIERKPFKMFYRGKPAKIPLLSLPVLKSFTQKNGFYVEQDDLDIKTYTDNLRRKKEVRMSVFDDKDRIQKFLETGSDEELEEEAEKILKKTNYKGFDIFGFSLTDEWNIAGFGSILVLSKLLKEKTGALIVLGGGDAGQILNLFSSENVLKLTDLIFLHANHLAHFHFLEVLKRLDSNNVVNKNSSFAYYFKDSYGRDRLPILKSNKIDIDLSFVHDKFQDIEKIFPTPDFQGLPLELYNYIPKDIKDNNLSNKKILVLPYHFSIGCPNNCIFCSCSANEGYLLNDPQLISDDLEHLSSTYKTNLFVFYNTSVNPTKEFLRNFMGELKQKDLNILWSDCAVIKTLDKNSIEQLYEVGARRLIYGVEASSPRLLSYVEKGTTISQIESVLRMSHEVGIWNEVELICGLPHETDDDINLTKKFLDRNQPYINYHNIHPFKLVHSRLSLNPKKYSIQNIRERNDKSIPGMAFDEVNGLKWQEKKKQILRSFKTIRTYLKKFPNYGFTDSDECFLKLIYLYSILGNKTDVLNYIKENPFN